MNESRQHTNNCSQTWVYLRKQKIFVFQGELFFGNFATNSMLTMSDTNQLSLKCQNILIIRLKDAPICPFILLIQVEIQPLFFCLLSRCTHMPFYTLRRRSFIALAHTVVQTLEYFPYLMMRCTPHVLFHIYWIWNTATGSEYKWNPHQVNIGSAMEKTFP